MDDEILIKAMPTPNPNALKFLINRDVKADGKATFTDLDACEHVPLAVALLSLPNVTQVHFFKNSVTVTQNGASDWDALRETIQDRIRAVMPYHDPEFEDDDPEVARRRLRRRDPEALSPELRAIEEILDRTIRPGLQADGGDIEVVELDDNILSVRYEGACGGCPSAMYGTLEAIKGILRDEFRPDLEVVVV